jgi:hypothetical protein
MFPFFFFFFFFFFGCVVCVHMYGTGVCKQERCASARMCRWKMGGAVAKEKKVNHNALLVVACVPCPFQKVAKQY